MSVSMLGRGFREGRIQRLAGGGVALVGLLLAADACSLRLPPSIVGEYTIAAGVSHSCGLGSDGSGWCWGSGFSGERGDGSTVRAHTPRAVLMPGTTRFAQISTGTSTTCAVDTDGAAWCWGNGEFGRRGDGTTTRTQATPGAVTMPVGQTFTQISVGNHHTCAIATDGSAWCWGSNGLGALGIGLGAGSQHTPAAVVMPPGVRFAQISAGDSATCAVATDGSAWCWGSNLAGKAGTGGVSSAASYGTPAAVALPTGVLLEQISTGGGGSTHVCALAAGGAAWCWGGGGSGQLGDGSTTGSRSTPGPVSMPAGKRFGWIDVGAGHTCAAATDGTGWCWGTGSDGRLGNGSLTSPQATPAPVTMPGGVEFTRISAGNQHTCAVAANGTAWCWGSRAGASAVGGNGQLGDGVTTMGSQATPVQVANMLRFAP